MFLKGDLIKVNKGEMHAQSVQSDTPIPSVWTLQ